MWQLVMRLGSGDPPSSLFLGDVQGCLNTGLPSVSQAGTDYKWQLIPVNTVYVTRRAWVKTKPATISILPSTVIPPIFLGYRVIPEEESSGM